MLRGIVIPPRPAIMVELQEIFAASESGIEEIAHVIGKDVALSADILEHLRENA